MNYSFWCVGIVSLVVFLGITTADDIKIKRGIEAQQNVFVADCSKQQDPNIEQYVARLKDCRTAAELKFPMPEYLSRVR